jgi:hypothetical protein
VLKLAKEVKMLPAPRLLSIDAQNICPLIRIADTLPVGAEVTPDWFVETADGSTL